MSSADNTKKLSLIASPNSTSMRSLCFNPLSTFVSFLYRYSTLENNIYKCNSSRGIRINLALFCFLDFNLRFFLGARSYFLKNLSFSLYVTLHFIPLIWFTFKFLKCWKTLKSVPLLLNISGWNPSTDATAFRFVCLLINRVRKQFKCYHCCILVRNTGCLFYSSTFFFSVFDYHH